MRAARADRVPAVESNVTMPFYRHWRLFRRAERELATLSDRELDDVGLSRGDIPLAVRGLLRR